VSQIKKQKREVDHASPLAQQEIVDLAGKFGDLNQRQLLQALDLVAEHEQRLTSKKENDAEIVELNLSEMEPGTQRALHSFIAQCVEDNAPLV